MSFELEGLSRRFNLSLYTWRGMLLWIHIYSLPFGVSGELQCLIDKNFDVVMFHKLYDVHSVFTLFLIYC